MRKPHFVVGEQPSSLSICAVWSATLLYSKTCVNRPLSERPKSGFQDRLSLNADQSIEECSKGSILQYFWPL